MNSALISLFKINLKQTFDFRGKNKKNIAFIVPILLILLSGCLISGLYALGIALKLREIDADLSLIVYSMAGATSIIILSTAVPKVKSTLFGGKDYDMLAALPIRKSYIVTVKFLSIYLSELLFSFALIIPSTFVVLIFSGSISILIDGILLFIFSPLVPLIISCMIGMLIGLVADRFRFGNIITVLLYSIFLIGVMYISFTFSSANQVENLNSLLDSLTFLTWINPATHILMLNLFGINYICYLLIHMIVFVGLSFIIGVSYDYFHDLMTSMHSHQHYVEKEVKTKGQFRAQLGIDLKRYFSSKSYLLNTITGGILSVVLVIIMVVIFYQIDKPDAVSIIKEQVAPYLPLMILWCSSMAIPSSVAITIEGKNFWQVKTLPMDYKTYSYSKIILSEIVIAPFILIASIVLLFFMDLNAIRIITTLLLPQLYFFAMNCFAYFINMKVYSFKWENETKAVKQTGSVLLSMLFDFIGSMWISVLLIVIGVFISYGIAAIISMGLCFALCILGFTLIKQNCQKFISQIEI